MTLPSITVTNTTPTSSNNNHDLETTHSAEASDSSETSAHANTASAIDKQDSRAEKDPGFLYVDKYSDEPFLPTPRTQRAFIDERNAALTRQRLEGLENTEAQAPVDKSTRNISRQKLEQDRAEAFKDTFKQKLLRELVSSFMDKATLSTHQDLDNENISNKKIDLAIQLKKHLETMEFANHKAVNPTFIAWLIMDSVSGEISDLQKQLKALDPSTPVLDKTNIDAFITQQVDHLLKEQEASNDKTYLPHLLKSLNPQEKNFLEELKKGTWQEKTSYQAFLILLKNGFTFENSKEIIHSENHQLVRNSSPTNYLDYLKLNAQPETAKQDLINFVES